MAQPGGVLTRAGHTEAGCDLVATGGLRAVRGHCRDHERRRHHGAPSAAGSLRASCTARDRHHSRSDPLSPAHRTHRWSALPIAPCRPSSVSSGCTAYEDHVHRDLHLALVRGSLDGPIAAAGAGASHRHAARPAWACAITGRAWTLRDAMKRIAEASMRRGDRAARPQESPRELADAISALGRVRDTGSEHPLRGAAHLRHRRTDPQGPGRDAHACAVGAQAAAGHFRLRPRGHRIRGSDHSARYSRAHDRFPDFPTSVSTPASRRVAIVAARFNAELVDQLIEGATQRLDEARRRSDPPAVVRTPGAFELPLAAHKLAASGRFDAGDRPGLRDPRRHSALRFRGR